MRLLTLIGTGGTGKTRLALQLAANMLDRFPGGAAFVLLTPVRDWELVVPTIAQTLGLREQPGESALETLGEYLRDKRLLLVLDNFEQVLPAAPALSSLLAEAPGLKLLATSRSPLHLSGEHAYRVPQLALPTRSSCSSSEPRPRPRTSSSPTRTPRPSRRSAAGSRACRWRSSWPRRGCARSRPRPSCAGSTSGCRC